MSAFRKTLAGFAIGGALSAGVASNAGAQGPPVVIGGNSLVTIQVVDVLTNNDVSVQVPIGVAANVCGTTVAVLAEVHPPTGFDCEAATFQDLPVVFQR